LLRCVGMSAAIRLLQICLTETGISAPLDEPPAKAAAATLASQPSGDDRMALLFKMQDSLLLVSSAQSVSQMAQCAHSG
jgi:hypothetical protein